MFNIYTFIDVKMVKFDQYVINYDMMKVGGLIVFVITLMSLFIAAVYLCKRTMQNKQRLELADYEAENLARLQKMFSRKWEFIFMQAEAQAK